MTLRIAALGMLAQRPGSGYDLLKRFEQSMANVWPATQSQLYNELKKLADADFIEISTVGPRGRKEYRITASGRAELLRWITNPQDDPPRRRPELLRVFLLGQVACEEAHKYITAFAEQAEGEIARLHRLRDSVDWSDDLRDAPADIYGRAALEYGLRSAAMEAEWATWLLRKVRRAQA